MRLSTLSPPKLAGPDSQTKSDRRVRVPFCQFGGAEAFLEAMHETRNTGRSSGPDDQIDTVSIDTCLLESELYLLIDPVQIPLDQQLELTSRHWQLNRDAGSSEADRC